MDTISNFIVKLKNAGLAGHESTTVQYSALKESIAQVLKKEGFVKEVETVLDNGKRNLKISLLALDRVPKIKGVSRVSKPSKRIYKKIDEIRAVKSGYGVLILSTSKGVMTGRDAKKHKLGGEALFTIW